MCCDRRTGRPWVARAGDAGGGADRTAGAGEPTADAAKGRGWGWDGSLRSRPTRMERTNRPGNRPAYWLITLVRSAPSIAISDRVMAANRNVIGSRLSPARAASITVPTVPSGQADRRPQLRRWRGTPTSSLSLARRAEGPPFSLCAQLTQGRLAGNGLESRAPLVNLWLRILRALGFSGNPHRVRTAPCDLAADELLHVEGVAAAGWKGSSVGQPE
jgi:hypothetical protein